MRHARGRPPWPDILTPREWQVVHAARHGGDTRSLAQRLGITCDAVRYHLKNIYAKLGIRGKDALKHWQGYPRGFPDARPDRGAQAMTGRIGQVSRSVSDAQEAERWYRDVLGLPHLYTFGKMVFFDCGGTRLLLVEKDEVNNDESLLYFIVEDIRRSHESLIERGVHFLQGPHHIHTHEDGTQEWMAFFNDPDGRPLGLMCQLTAMGPG